MSYKPRKAYPCKKHPSYQAKRVPTGGCRACWEYWFRKHGDTPAKRLETFHHPDHLERP